MRRSCSASRSSTVCCWAWRSDCSSPSTPTSERGHVPCCGVAMKKQPQATAGMRKLADLIGDAGIAMLTTEDADGALRSRPLATLQLDSEGKLWFFTAMSSAKVGEIDQHRHVNLSYANPEKQEFVSISGSARLLRDRQKIHEVEAVGEALVLPWSGRPGPGPAGSECGSSGILGCARKQDAAADRAGSGHDHR